MFTSLPRRERWWIALCLFRLTDYAVMWLTIYQENVGSPSHTGFVLRGPGVWETMVAVLFGCELLLPRQHGMQCI